MQEGGGLRGRGYGCLRGLRVRAYEVVCVLRGGVYDFIGYMRLLLRGSPVHPRHRRSNFTRGNSINGRMIILITRLSNITNCLNNLRSIILRANIYRVKNETNGRDNT